MEVVEVLVLLPERGRVSLPFVFFPSVCYHPPRVPKKREKEKKERRKRRERREREKAQHFFNTNFLHFL